MKVLPKLEMAAAIGSLATILLCGLLRQAALRTGVDQETADLTTRSAFLLLFYVFAFSCIGLMLHVFVVLQIRIGNGQLPMVRLRNRSDIRNLGLLGLWNADRAPICVARN